MLPWVLVWIAEENARLAETNLLLLFVFIGGGKFLLGTPPLFSVGHVFEVDIVEYYVFCIGIIRF